MKFFKFVLVLLVVPGSTWAISQGDLVTLLSKPEVLDKLQGLQLKKAEGSFFQGVHVQFSFFDLSNKPTITGVRYRSIHAEARKKGSAKIVFSVRPEKQQIDAAGYKLKMSIFNSFSPTSVNVVRFKKDDDSSVKVEFLDSGNVARYVQWLSISSNKLVTVAYYDQNRHLLYVDTSFDDSVGEFSAKPKNYILEKLPLALLTEEKGKEAPEFSDIDQDRRIGQKLINYAVGTKRESNDRHDLDDQRSGEKR